MRQIDPFSVFQSRDRPAPELDDPEKRPHCPRRTKKLLQSTPSNHHRLLVPREEDFITLSYLLDGEVEQGWHLRHLKNDNFGEFGKFVRAGMVKTAKIGNKTTRTTRLGPMRVVGWVGEPRMQ